MIAAKIAEHKQVASEYFLLSIRRLKKMLRGYKCLRTIMGFILLLYKINAIKSAMICALIFSVVLTNVGLLDNSKAESGEGKDVFKVVVTLFGITNSTKDVLTLVNVQDQTKIKLFNPEDPQNEGLDKVSYTLTFPGINVQDGDPYTVCTMSTDNFKLRCEKGNNSPLNRPEFVDINLGSGSSNKDKEEGNNKD